MIDFSVFGMIGTICAEPAMIPRRNTRVRIRIHKLFDDPARVLADESEIRRLAAIAQVTRKTMVKMLESSEQDGFMSRQIFRLCEAEGRNPEDVIIGRKLARPRRPRGDAVAGGTRSNEVPADGELPEATPVAAESARREPMVPVTFSASAPINRAGRPARILRREFEQFVPGDRSIHDSLDPSSMIRLHPGESLHFVDFDKHKQWTHDCHGGFKRDLLESIEYFPPEWGSRLATAVEIAAACHWLDELLVYVVRHIVRSFAIPRLRLLAEQRGRPVDWLIHESEKVLASMGRTLPPETHALPKYVEGLKQSLRETRRMIPIICRQDGSLARQAALTLWQRARGRPHLEAYRAGDPRAWHAFSPWLGPQGHSTPAAREHYPLPSAPAGACVCVCGTFDPQQGFAVRRVCEFFRPDHEVWNDTAGVMHCFLICNDDRPGDNLGGVLIQCRILAPAHPPPQG
ncbi:MAG: hypothetical protein NZ561_01550 [Phycisphaerae bacterium]|nr:hypothetical protein [Phycisphaerae bacterium]MDW8262561.1 hypothetical protein [Phycisphaerales bacterium]